MNIIVDGVVYKTKKEALNVFKDACMCCDGSEGERMSFAYFEILNGAKYIDTYSGTSIYK